MMDEPSAATTAQDPAQPDINSRIASRVLSLRTQLGLSLDALASKSGVSRSMISLIERGESNPTAVVLAKVATGLGLPLAALFEAPRISTGPISRRIDRTTWRDPQSGYVRCNISPDGIASPIQIVEVILPAGAHVAYETGARDVNIHQQVWVQRGRIEVTVGNVTYKLSQDDCLAMQLNAPTAFRNRTRQSARYLVTIVSDHSRAQKR
jgi:transcriptional regulator with XRE-family HTH domain